MTPESTAETGRAEIGVIGGSGLYKFLSDAVPVTVDTPYGPPSDPVVIGDVGGRKVAFLPRHGSDHRYPPHRIPYRANLWALRSLGVRQVLAPCAVGGLQPDHGAAVHVSFADPYCPDGRRAVLDTAGTAGVAAIDGGTMVVVEGPRFSTRAESQWYAGQGWSLVNMTGYPEAVLARELALCYTSIALVTDLDAGVSAEEAVSQEEVYRVFAEHTETVRSLLFDVIDALPATRTCPCAHALDDIPLPLELP
jgi:5'-methylthioadenosine phosphorylase